VVGVVGVVLGVVGGLAVAELLERQLRRLGEEMILDAEAAPPAPFMEAVRARAAARQALRLNLGLSCAAGLVLAVGAIWLILPPVNGGRQASPPVGTHAAASGDPDSHHPKPPAHAIAATPGPSPQAGQSPQPAIEPPADPAHQPVGGQPRREPEPAPK